MVMTKVLLCKIGYPNWWRPQRSEKRILFNCFETLVIFLYSTFRKIVENAIKKNQFTKLQIEKNSLKYILKLALTIFGNSIHPPDTAPNSFFKNETHTLRSKATVCFHPKIPVPLTAKATGGKGKTHMKRNLSPHAGTTKLKPFSGARARIFCGVFSFLKTMWQLEQPQLQVGVFYHHL